MDEEVKKIEEPQVQGILNKELMKQFLDSFKRKQKKNLVSKEVNLKREKMKKIKRREANKSRKINQAKNK